MICDECANFKPKRKQTKRIVPFSRTTVESLGPNGEPDGICKGTTVIYKVME